VRPLLPSCPRVIATWGGRQQHGCYSASCCLAPDDEIGSNEVKEGSPEWRAFCRIAIATALPRGPAVASPATQESSALCINDRSKDGLRRSRPRQGPRPVARRGSDALIAEDHHPCRPRDDWELPSRSAFAAVGTEPPTGPSVTVVSRAMSARPLTPIAPAAVSACPRSTAAAVGVAPSTASGRWHSARGAAACATASALPT